MAYNPRGKFSFVETSNIHCTCKLYDYYESMLGEENGYYPPGAAIDPTNRVFAMYHSNSASSVKKAVLQSLADPKGKVRRVFATQSLSMGINCQNLRCVYHWGAPRTLEQYFQEVGRGGRDGNGTRLRGDRWVRYM